MASRLTSPEEDEPQNSEAGVSEDYRALVYSK